MNTASISGRLGELKPHTLKDGTKVVNTTIYKDLIKIKDVEEMQPMGIPVSFFGKIADRVMSFFQEGDHVLVSGILKGSALHDFFILSLQGKVIYLLQELEDEKGEDDVQ